MELFTVTSVEIKLGNGYIIQHQCPQCGAPVTFQEADHTLCCPFCRIRLYMTSRDYFRYFLSHENVLPENLIYAPYLRLRGMSYTCKPYRINYRVIDTSILSCDFKQLPSSLGLKPQALKLRFLHPGLNAGFLKYNHGSKEFFETLDPSGIQSKKEHSFYSEFIGETTSMVYAPFYHRGGTLYDAITNTPAAHLICEDIEKSMPLEKNPGGNITFLPTLCPDCGWDLEGEKQGIVLFCTNCDSAWMPIQKGFKKLPFRIMASEYNDKTYHLPFWRMEADFNGIEMQSYADLIRLANLPKAIQKKWESMGVSFWSPAFKIQPKLFLRLSKQMTISQPCANLESGIKNLTMHPVTLSLKEATESIIITLADLITDKKKFYPLLPRIKVNLRKHVLTYLPFHVRANEFIQCNMNFSISRNALKIGSKI